MDELKRDAAIGLRRDAVSSQLLARRGQHGGGGVPSFVLGFLVGVQFAPLPLNVALVDGLFVFLLVLRVTSPGRGERGFRWVTPWIWLIGVGSVVGMFSTPHLGDSMLHLVRDAYAFGILALGVWWLSVGATRWRAVVYGMVAVGCLCSILVAVSPETRPSGTFLNPNYAGHYLAVLIVLVLATRAGLSRWILLTVPLLLVGMLGSGSFGAILIAVSGLCYLGWNVGEKRLPRRLLARSALVAMVAVVSFQGVIGSALESDYAVDNGLSENRFDKSETGRLDRYSTGLSMAAAHPFGVGPGGAVYVESSLKEHELHNDYLAFLVERTVLGLVGLVGLLVGLWRRMKPAGAARSILVMLAAGSMVRETLNFRHLWLALAVAVVYDALGRRSGDPPVPAEASDRRDVLGVRR
jgi:O-antigen ligase/polysaccharide polymerase Wzy-like membrane protein